MSKLLEFVRFKDCNLWSVATLLENQFNYNEDYELVKIGSFLKRNKTQIIIDDDTEYKRVTIKLYNKGVFLRDREIGKNIGTKKQFCIKEGQFLLSKIDARNGAFGLATPEVDGAIITADFFAYDIDITQINPYFLVLMTTTKQFMKFAQSASSGTTGRQRIDEKKFLDVKTPLPSLDIQKQIVKQYQDRINLATSQEQQAGEKEMEIEEYLYQELGIEITSKEETKLLSFVKFKNIERWDASYLLDANNIQSSYELVPLHTIINTFLQDLNNNSLRFESKRYPDKAFRYIGMENIEKETGILLNFQDVKGVDIKSQTIKLPKNFLLYGKLRPYLNKYYLNENDFDNIIVSSEFFVFSVKNIDKYYFKYILSSSFIQNQIENHMKGARMPRISEGTFKNLKIPNPPLNIQNQIANHIQALKNEIKTLKTEAQKNRKLALVEFEMEIFNEA